MDESDIPRLDELRSAAPLRWTAPENLHITTKFIGEWPEERLPELEAALAGVPFPGDLNITVTGFEILPRLVLASVKPSPELMALNQATEDALEGCGCAREQRAYRPHVTLARLTARPPHGLRETIARMKDCSATFSPPGFHLYLSRPGSLYTKLASYS